MKERSVSVCVHICVHAIEVMKTTCGKARVTVSLTLCSAQREEHCVLITLQMVVNLTQIKRKNDPLHINLLHHARTHTIFIHFSHAQSCVTLHALTHTPLTRSRSQGSCPLPEQRRCGRTRCGCGRSLRSPSSAGSHLCVCILVCVLTYVSTSFSALSVVHMHAQACASSTRSLKLSMLFSHHTLIATIITHRSHC